jgi:hypothetical protein
MTNVRNAMNPLPSLIRASARDAACSRMRTAGRKVWNRADYNEAARTQHRLIKVCYRLKGDKGDERFIRFAIAEQMQRDRYIDLYSDWPKVMAVIEQVRKTGTLNPASLRAA